MIVGLSLDPPSLEVCANWPALIFGKSVDCPKSGMAVPAAPLPTALHTHTHTHTHTHIKHKNNICTHTHKHNIYACKFIALISHHITVQCMHLLYLSPVVYLFIGTCVNGPNSIIMTVIMVSTLAVVVISMCL